MLVNSARRVLLSLPLRFRLDTASLRQIELDADDLGTLRLEKRMKSFVMSSNVPNTIETIQQ